MARIKIEDLVESLFDYAVEHPEGFTMSQFRGKHRCGVSTFGRAVKMLRDILGADDQINLICDPPGDRTEWIYQLVGDPDKAAPWVKHRLTYTESAIETVSGVVKSLVKATDPRTRDGRRVRVTNKALNRLLEDLADIEGDGYLV